MGIVERLLLAAYRRGAEEAMMIDQFGEADHRCAARVPRLLPRLRGNGR